MSVRIVDRLQNRGRSGLRSRMLGIRTDNGGGWRVSGGGVYLQDDAAVTLSSLLPIPLTLGIWLRQSLSGN